MPSHTTVWAASASAERSSAAACNAWNRVRTRASVRGRMAFALTQRRLLATLLPLVLVLVLAGMPTRARADEAPQLAEPAHERARGAAGGHLDTTSAGREHFRAGRYGEAIVELEGRAGDRSRLREPACTTWRIRASCWASSTTPSTTTRSTWQRCPSRPEEGAREDPAHAASACAAAAREQAAEPAASAAAAARRPSRPPGRADVWFWVSLGGGAALLAGGGVTGVLALQREDDVGNFVVGKDGSLKQHHALIDQANTLALSSDLLFAGGAALVVGSALLYFLRDATEHARRARAALHDGRRSRYAASSTHRTRVATSVQERRAPDRNALHRSAGART